MTAFSSLKIVGGLLPADLLGRVSAGDPQVPGTSPQTYGLERGESVRRQASRSWLYLLEVWQDFKRRVEGPGAAEAASARVTRERWLRILLRELGFHELAGGGFELEGKSFPVSHRSGHVPVHLLGWATDLDHKTPHVTARAPQSMLQELLNRDDAYLWAILSNGATLRLLRDSTALVGSSYVEFDLEAIFDGELFSDFVLLYLICHESRFAVQGDGGPASCYLEQWRGVRRRARRAGTRSAAQRRPAGHLHPRHRVPLPPGQPAPARPPRSPQRGPEAGRLQPGAAAAGVPDAVLVRRRGPRRAPAARPRRRRHRDQRQRCARPATGTPPTSPPPGCASSPARHRGGRHGDLFDAVQLVFDALGTEGGVPELALPGIGGIFESQRDDGTPAPARRTARRRPPVQRGAARRRPRPVPGEAARRRRLAPGRLRQPRRRRTRQRLRIPAGTDPPLRPRAARLHAGDTARQRAQGVRLLLHANVAGRMPARLRARPAARRGMRPRDRRRNESRRCSTSPSATPPAAPATSSSPPPAGSPSASPPRKPASPSHPTPWSGQRCAASSAAASTASTSTPWPPNWPRSRSGWKHWNPASRCPTSTRTSASATPCSASPQPCWPKACPTRPSPRSKATTARSPQPSRSRTPRAPGPARPVQPSPASRSPTPSWPSEPPRSPTHCPTAWKTCTSTSSARPSELAESPEHRIQKLLADAWCAAFVQPKTDETRATAITQAVLEQFGADAGTLDLAAAEDLVDDLTRQYRFFHWHVEFPHIFRVGNGATDIDPATGWAGGFSCVIGNPPWERVKLQEQEFFASREPEIANAPNAAARKKLIAALADSDSPADQDAVRRVPGRAAQGSRLEPPAPRIRPLPAHRPRRHQHLRRLRRDRPHGHRRDVAAAASSCRPASPPTRPPLRSSATWFATRKLVSFLDFENEAFLLSRAVAPSRSLLPAHRLRPRGAREPGKLRVRHPLHAAISQRAGSPCRPRRSCSSTRTPAPPRSSGPAATPRSRSASTSASPSSGATNPRRTPGACRSWRCSTWPTTPACSGPAISWNAMAGR